jgi:hypothetical protein
MKNKLFYLIGLCLIPGLMLGQRPIEVSSSSFKLGQDDYEGVRVWIPEAEFERVDKMWIKDLERGTKSKVSEAHQGEVTIFGAYLKSLSDDPVNIYSQIIPRDSLVEVNACVELKRSEFITEEGYESEFNQLKEHMHDFGKEVYIEVVSDQVKAEIKVLRELEKELKKLQNEKDKMEKSISKNQHDITVSEDAIRTHDADIAVKNEEIAREKVSLSTIDDPTRKEAQEDKLKELEKEKKKMQRAIQKEKKNIVGNESNIDNTRLEIPAIVEQQNQKMMEIQRQIDRVNDFEAKLDIVKGY